MCADEMFSLLCLMYQFDGDVPRGSSYGVYISQFIRFARASSHVSDFNCRNKALKPLLMTSFIA